MAKSLFGRRFAPENLCLIRLTDGRSRTPTTTITTGRQGNGATRQQDNPQMAPVKPICGNQIKVALQEARKNPSARGVVDSIKIKLAALLVANFVIIRCQFRVAVCVCVLRHVCPDDKMPNSTNNSHTSTRAEAGEETGAGCSWLVSCWKINNQARPVLAAPPPGSTSSAAAGFTPTRPDRKPAAIT